MHNRIRGISLKLIMLVSMTCLFYAFFPFRGCFWPPFRFSLTQSDLAASLNFSKSKCYPFISCRSVVPVKLSLLVSLCSVSCSSKLSLSFVSCRLIKSHKISCQVLDRKVFVLIILITRLTAFFCSVLLPRKQFLLFMTDMI
jgi:hypothetical protein